LITLNDEKEELLMIDIKWVRENMNLNYLDKRNGYIITVKNTGNLEFDFKKYSLNFYDAAETTILYLLTEASEHEDIKKLDLWYFAIIYLYRQSLELMLKACVFQLITDIKDRKEAIGKLRHDLTLSFDEIIKRKGMTLSKNELWLKEFLLDITKIDKESDMFRYPFSTDKKVLFEKQTDISLVATYENMKKAYSIIRAIYDDKEVIIGNDKFFEPKLIIEGGNYYEKSVVGYKYRRASYEPYFTSYLEVGNFLNDIIIEQKRSELFIPMCYVYRNAIELGLKRILIEESQLNIDEIHKIMRKKKHSILGIWHSIESEIKEAATWPTEYEMLNNAQRYIDVFHVFDNVSDKFRYPCDKNMNFYFLTPTKFDSKNIASCFEELCNFLEGVDEKMNLINEYEAEKNTSYYG